ncbi:MAG: hypothetical protein V4582_07265 [Pseudomonadota bacterium]
MNLRGNPENGCNAVDALVQTMERGDADKVLRKQCGRIFDAPDFYASGRPLSGVDREHWIFNLDFFYGMSPACTMVTMAHVWQSERRIPDTQSVDRLALALKNGVERAAPPMREQALHALAYLVARLPGDTRAQDAARLLAPAQHAMIDTLEQAQSKYLDELARLIVASGPLQPGARQRLTAIAGGTTRAAAHARVVLAQST